MAQHTAIVEWERGDAAFVDQRYSRAHRWSFDGGLGIPASSSPHVVPLPMSDAHAVDPEEAFVASIASCHMLFFLSIAATRQFRVDRYEDHAVGTMARDAGGKVAVTRVVLRPRVLFSGALQPAPAQIDAMHHEAHAECFIANSVRTEIVCEPRVESTAWASERGADEVAR